MLTDDEKNQHINEGTLRLMTPGEIIMAKEIFGRTITWHRIWVHCESYLPFGLQGKHVGMSPNGEIYFRKQEYLSDFSNINDYPKQHMFIHELAHVWQHQHGQWVRLRGAFSWAANYTYDFTKTKILTDYSLEQQASIIADYWLLIHYGYESWEYGLGWYVNYRGVHDKDIKINYEKVLAHFLHER